MLYIQLDGVEIPSFEAILFQIIWYTFEYNLANTALTSTLLLPLRSN